MSSALERLKLKQKQRKAGITTKPTELKDMQLPTSSESCVGKNLGLAEMLNKTKSNTKVVDAIASKIKEREDAGLYSTEADLSSLQGSDAEDIMDKLRELDHALIAKTSDIGLLTIKIRQNLEKFPELTHLLDDQQLGIICSGVLTMANVATEPKTKAAKSKQEVAEINNLASTVDASMI